MCQAWGLGRAGGSQVSVEKRKRCHPLAIVDIDLGTPSPLRPSHVPTTHSPESTRRGLLCNSVKIKKYLMMENMRRGSKLTIQRFPGGCSFVADTGGRLQSHMRPTMLCLWDR